MVYLVPVLARIMGCIGALLVLFACYIYIQFYDYDRCNYYSNTYHKWFYDAIDIDKYTKRVGRLIAKDAIKRHLRFASLHNNSNVNIERDFKV